jgi:hypothetical protein
MPRYLLVRPLVVAVLVLAGALAPSGGGAAAQDASPAASPVVGETIRSMTREEFNRRIEAHYPLEEPQTQGGTLIDSTVGEFRTLNPMVANDAGSGAVVGNVFDGLVGSSPIDGQPAPNGLADRWEIAPDGVTYTFHLNKAEVARRHRLHGRGRQFQLRRPSGREDRQHRHRRVPRHRRVLPRHRPGHLRGHLQRRAGRLPERALPADHG